MMKLLFGILLLLSIMFFVLMQWGGALTGSANNVQPLGELNPEKIILLGKPGSAVLSLHSAAASAPVIAASSIAGVMVPVAASAAPLPASVPAPALALVPAPAKNVVSAAPATKPALPAPAPSAPAKEKVSRPPAPFPLHAPAAAPVAKAAANICMEWGEFSGKDLSLSKKALSAMNLGNRLGQRTVEYPSGYWVYMPPLKNKEAVKRKIAQLKALGVEDYYVVNEPPKMVNVISLGVFKTREAAKSLLASLHKKGVRTAIMGERKHKLKFIVFEIGRIGEGEAAHLSKLKKDFPDSELKKVNCK